MLTLHINGHPVAQSPDFAYLERMYHAHHSGDTGWITAVSQFPEPKSTKPPILSPERAEQVRQMYATGKYIQNDLAVAFGVHTRIICRIVNRTGAYR